MTNWWAKLKYDPLPVLFSNGDEAITFSLAHTGNTALWEENIREIIIVYLEGITNQ